MNRYHVTYYYLATGMEGRADEIDYGIIEANTAEEAKLIAYPSGDPSHSMSAILVKLGEFSEEETKEYVELLNMKENLVKDIRGENQHFRNIKDFYKEFKGNLMSEIDTFIENRLIKELKLTEYKLKKYE